jgi:glycosyltransferase involved in cell wall biosynthesis
MSETDDEPITGVSLASPSDSARNELAKLPLVSLVVINWNYGDYVGETIDSLRAQDYPELEILVVDNGSTDHSRDVIDAHIEGDSRFRTSYLPSNVGQLGAFFQVLPSLGGQFVSTVDADDVMRPNFVSSHVQVHLALPHNVGLTSSNLVEIDGKGRALTSHYEAINTVVRPYAMGLRRIESVVRLPTISDPEYHSLSRSVFLYQPGGGWLWSPGSSNMYRRAVVELVRHRTPNGVWMRAADSFLNPLCHSLGGSALIDQTLSGYRVHGANYFSERESLMGMLHGRVDAIGEFEELDGEVLDIFLGKAAMLRPILAGRFWSVFDHLTSNLRGPTGHLRSSPAVLAPLRNHYPTLTKLFGEKEVREQLGARIVPEDFEGVFQHGLGAVPPSVLDMVHGMELVRNAIERNMEDFLRLANTAVNAIAQEGTSGPDRSHSSDLQPALPDPSHRHTTPAPVTTPSDTAPLSPVAQRSAIPFGTISVDPPIILSGISFDEFCGIADAFGEKYGNLPAGFLIYPTWTIAGEARASQVVAAAQAHLEKYPSHHLIYLCSAAEESDRLAAGGLECQLLNTNCLISEHIFRPLADSPMDFDAIYNARFDARKRHYLASQIDRVAYISYEVEMAGQTRSEQRELLLEHTLRHPAHVLINPTDNGSPISLTQEEVNAALNRAAVGLCLSGVEGANLASMEYLLSGLPVVSTPSIGGRDVYFDHEYCTICDPEPGAVRHAVESFLSRRIPREYIRERTLAKIEEPRQQFLSLVNDLSERLGGQRLYGDGSWPFPTLGAMVRWGEQSSHLDDFEQLRQATSGGANDRTHEASTREANT